MAVFSIPNGSASPQDEVPATTWIFDRTDQIGGHPATVLGHPHVIDTPLGKAVEFNGIDDALLIDAHPLAARPSLPRARADLQRQRRELAPG